MIDRRLKLRHVQAFAEIAHQQSLKRAARVLNLSQPAISRTLKELEEITGVRLLERSRSGVRVTIEGEIFLRFASSGLTALGQAMQSVSAIASGRRGTVSLGALPSVAARILPKAAQIFAQLAPDVILHVEDGPHDYLVDHLRNAKLDLVIGRLGKPETMKDISFTQLYIEDVAVVCAPGHPMSNARTLASLSAFPVIYPPKNAAIRPLVDRMMIADGMGEFAQRIESVSATFGREMTLTGEALWIISTGVVAADIAAGRLVALPIKTDLTVGPIGIMARAETGLSLPASVFRQAAIRAVEDLRLNA